jgi:hypothetical protein
LPTHIARAFDRDREISEQRMRGLLTSVLGSATAKKVGALVAERLGRPLEAFDLWYPGFRPRSALDEAALDQITRQRYPDAAALQRDLPRIFEALGFAPDTGRFLAERIVVDPARGAGHAAGAQRRADQAHLRTRIGTLGLDYKGFNIAIHELGHNVEQVFSLNGIDHWWMQGVPNNAFTEAMAFLFQARDLELLGLGGPDPDDQALRVLDTFWMTREIAGVSLVDMAAWRWLYQHPDATPAQFRDAVVTIAQDVWDRYHAPLLGGQSTPLLAIYTHTINEGLYLPDYALGHLISFQIEEHFRKRTGPMGPEIERLCQLGAITPDAWMRQGLGAPLSAEPLLAATTRALEAME